MTDVTPRRFPENLALIVLIAGTAALCVLLVVVPPASSGGDGHGHGHDGGEDEERHEGPVVELDADALAEAGMSLEQTAAVQIHPTITSRGQITEDGHRSMNVKPRFGGIVRSVPKDFGDVVKRGDVLLVVESAATRQIYQVRSAIDGIVADKRVVTGSYIPEGESVLRIVDLASVWFQGRIAIRDAAQVAVGSGASVVDDVLGVKGKGSIVFLSPTVDEDTQARDVRIAIDNKSGNWRIGGFAEARIELPTVDVPVAVKSAALQTLEGRSVVFKQEEDHLVPVPVSIGWSDGIWTEVKGGLKAGDSYVSANSFLAKAELLKSSAGHDH